MSKLLYNDYYDQMELTEESGHVETQLIVPPYMQTGDRLTPFQFTVLSSRIRFYLFGRYNEASDTVEYVIAGPPGHKYKITFTDGNSPYGWKIKKHGRTRSDPFGHSMMQKVTAYCMEKFLVMVGKEPSRDIFRDIVENNAFAMEEVVGVPMAMLRASEREGVMDAKEKCINPWSFYGPSLPEAFCRCRLKLMIYPKFRKKTRTKGRGNDSFLTQSSKGSYRQASQKDRETQKVSHSPKPSIQQQPTPVPLQSRQQKTTPSKAPSRSKPRLTMSKFYTVSKVSTASLPSRLGTKPKTPCLASHGSESKLDQVE